MMVQIAEHEVIVIGGRMSMISIETHQYYVPRRCLLIDLDSGIVSEK